MRLKCALKNPALLAKVCSCLEKAAASKQSSACIMRFTPTKLHISLAMDSNQDNSLALFAHLTTESLFEGYEVESLMANEIALELPSIDFLTRALRSVDQAVLRLGKVPDTQQPLLVIRCLTRNRNAGGEVTLKQEIPCKVLTATAAAAIREPVMGRIGAHIMLPDLYRLRSAVDRMKSLAGHIKISANMRGHFRLHVESDTAEVTTDFSELEHPELDLEQVGATQFESLAADPAAFTETIIDMRNMIRFMHCSHANPSEIVCCLYGQYGLVFHVYIGSSGSGSGIHTSPEDSVLTYFIAGCE